MWYGVWVLLVQGMQSYVTCGWYRLEEMHGKDRMV